MKVVNKNDSQGSSSRGTPSNLRAAPIDSKTQCRGGPQLLSSSMRKPIPPPALRSPLAKALSLVSLLPARGLGVLRGRVLFYLTYDTTASRTDSSGKTLVTPGACSHRHTRPRCLCGSATGLGKWLNFPGPLGSSPSVKEEGVGVGDEKGDVELDLHPTANANKGWFLHLKNKKLQRKLNRCLLERNTPTSSKGPKEQFQ